MNDTLLQMLQLLLVSQMKKDQKFAQSFGALSTTMDNLFGLMLIQQKQIELLAAQIYKQEQVQEAKRDERTVN